MSYTLWSRNRLLGHTDLDIPCPDSALLQGFIEPTPDGARLLPEAIVSLAATARSAGATGSEESETSLADYRAACDRRDALALELRDEAGNVLDGALITVHDLQDRAWEALDEPDTDVEAMVVDFGGSFEPFDVDDMLDPELEAAIQHDLEELLRDRAPSGAPPMLDERWETMQYHVVVELRESSPSAEASH